MFWRVTAIVLTLSLILTIALIDLAVDRMNDDLYDYIALERYTRHTEIIAVRALMANQNLMQHINEMEPARKKI